MATRKGTGLEIATQGFANPNGLGIATQGFVEPILGDLIISGSAGIARVLSFTASNGLVIGGAPFYNITRVYAPQGGVVIDGAGTVKRGFAFAASDGLALSGTAGVSTSVTATIGGDLAIGGTASHKYVRAYETTGGIAIGGEAVNSISRAYETTGGITIGGTAGLEILAGNAQTGTGGVVIGGTAGVTVIASFRLGRGGASRPRRRVMPGTAKPQPYKKDNYVSPKEYWEKIQAALKKRDERFNYIGSGGIKVKPGSKVIVIQADLEGPVVNVDADFDMPAYVAIQLEQLFSNATVEEIINADDHLIINDLLGEGKHIIRPGKKTRFEHKAKMGGKADVSFKPAQAIIEHFDYGRNRRREEDELLALGDLYETKGRKRSREDDEIELLGLL